MKSLPLYVEEILVELLRVPKVLKQTQPVNSIYAMANILRPYCKFSNTFIYAYLDYG